MRCAMPLVVVLGMCVLAGCASVNKVYPVGDAPGSVQPGIFQVLPKTKARLTVTMKVVKANKGKENCESCNNASENSWIKIVQASVDVYPVPDPKQVYVVDAKSSFLKDMNLSLAYNDIGALNTATVKVEDKTFKYVVEAIKFAGSMISVMGVPKSGGSKSNNQKVTACPKEVLEAQGRSKELDKIRYELITVTGGISGESYEKFKFRIDEIDKMIAEAESKTSCTDTYDVTLVYDLEDDFLEKGGEVAVFSFDNGGLCVNGKKSVQVYSDNAGFTYSSSDDMDSQGNVPRFILKNTPDTEYPDTVRTNSAAVKGVRGLRYRIPGRARLTAWYGESDASTLMLLDKTVSVAQNGVVMSLPARMGSNSVEQNIEFYAETGALKTLGVQAKGLAVEDAAALGNGVLALVQATRKETNSGSGSDPTLLMLERTKEYLNLQYEIQELRKKLQ